MGLACCGKATSTYDLPKGRSFKKLLDEEKALISSENLLGLNRVQVQTVFEALKPSLGSITWVAFHEKMEELKVKNLSPLSKVS
jgi:hypothetical protein